MNLALILIHGIGSSSENWAEPVVGKLHGKVIAELKKILQEKAPVDISEVLAVKSVYWKTALEKPESALQRVLAGYFKWIVGGLNIWDGLFKGIYNKVYKYQNMIVTLFIGDIVGYMSKEGKMGIEEKIDEALKTFSAEFPDKDIPLTFISHSLGTVIASNYIFDRMDVHRRTGANCMDERFIFSNMFTAGSPIALFSMKFDGPESFNRPIEVEDPKGRWINFLDKDDPIAMPLKALNPSYNKAVFSDYQVNSGWFWGTAHTEYFNRTNMLDLIARKLAIDWISSNNLKSKDEITTLYEEYDKTFGS